MKISHHSHERNECGGSCSCSSKSGSSRASPCDFISCKEWSLDGLWASKFELRIDCAQDAIIIAVLFVVVVLGVCSSAVGLLVISLGFVSLCSCPSWNRSELIRSCTEVFGTFINWPNSPDDVCNSFCLSWIGSCWFGTCYCHAASSGNNTKFSVTVSCAYPILLFSISFNVIISFLACKFTSFGSPFRCNSFVSWAEICCFGPGSTGRKSSSPLGRSCCVDWCVRHLLNFWKIIIFWFSKII